MLFALLCFLALTVSPFAQTSRSDFDGSGSVDFTDFLLFADNFRSSDALYDLDSDGAVGFTDFLLFIDDYTAANTPPVSSASYTVTFASIWSATTHPNDFPPEGIAHYSPLVGATHSADVAFWTSGEAATEGIKQMAETGQTGALSGEINAAIGAGTAGAVLLGLDLDPTPGSINLMFDVDENNPMVTLVTMIAPSPDWFVGVSGVNLFEDGAWVEEVMVALRPWDAGTDSGTTYTSEDEATVPADVIRAISGFPFSSQALGMFTFTKN